MSYRRVAAGAAVALSVLFPLCSSPPPAVAATPSALLKTADAAFGSLKASRKKLKYRHNYEAVFKRYRRVFEGSPRSREAETALLHAGDLYTLLYRWSSNRAALDRSRDLYLHLLKDYPESSLADDAQMKIAFLYLNYYNDPARAYREFARVAEIAPRGDQSGEAARWLKKLKRYRSAAAAKQPAPPAGNSRAAAALNRAESGFKSLRSSSKKQRFRHNYEKVRDRYRLVFEKYPGSAEAATALYRLGELHELLFRWTAIASDINSAKYYFQRLVTSFPSSPLADDAQMKIANLYRTTYKDPARAWREYAQVLEIAPRGDQASAAKRWLEKLRKHRPAEPAPSPARRPGPIPAVLARVKGVRHWSNTEYSRIVIDLDQDAHFYANLLKESSALHKPPRLYVDLFNTAVEKGLRKPIPVNDGILHTVRVGQFTPDTVRVVLDIDQLKTYNIFPMENPFRLVIDAFGGGSPRSGPATVASAPRTPDGAISLAQQLGLGIRRVVVDAGHGAQDPGAIGVGGLKEKDVTLDLALRLKKLLEQEGLEVILTRDRDVFLPLHERTAIANTSRGDLFLSLHANSSDGKALHGIETYFLNLASSKRAMATAAKENSMSLAKMSDLQDIVKEIFNSKMDESSRLADIIQKQMVGTLRSRYRDITNLGVKQAPFYVLIGAQMPSILAEVSFLNHPVEGKRLASATYRQYLAAALAAGVKDYINSVKLAASD